MSAPHARAKLSLLVSLYKKGKKVLIAQARTKLMFLGQWAPASPGQKLVTSELRDLCFEGWAIPIGMLLISVLWIWEYWAEKGELECE